MTCPVCKQPMLLTQSLDVCSLGRCHKACRHGVQEALRRDDGDDVFNAAAAFVVAETIASAFESPSMPDTSSTPDTSPDFSSAFDGGSSGGGGSDGSW